MQHKNFFMVSNRIFDLEMKPRNFTVYCCLLRHSSTDQHSCFPSRRLIAEECSMDRKTVDSAIKNLSALGFIRKIVRHRENGSKTSNLYYVTNLLEQSKSSVRIVLKFRINNKTHRTRLKYYYNRKERLDSNNIAHVSPTDRLCDEERREPRKHPPQKGNRPFGRFGGKVGKENSDSLSGIFDGSKEKQEKAQAS